MHENLFYEQLPGFFTFLLAAHSAFVTKFHFHFDVFRKYSIQALFCHIHAVSSATHIENNYDYSYDANGNMQTGPDFTDPDQIAARTLAFNADNMPEYVAHASFGIVNFLYDGEGKRAKKDGPSGTTYYLSNEYEVINGLATHYIFVGNLRIAKVTGTNPTYFHKDHLNSSTVMTDTSGAALESGGYLPYGIQRENPGITLTNYKFTDQELDKESGLYNYDARLYDPVIGRFISPDTIVPRPFDPQSLNRYSYCRNNPLIYVDPSGHHFGSSEPGGEADFGGETVSGEPNDSPGAEPRGDEGWADFFDSSKSFEEQHSEYYSILMDKLNPIRNNNFIPTLENLNRLKESDKLVGIKIELSEHTLDVTINGATVFATASAISGAIPATITFTIIGGVAKSLKSSNTPCNDAISQGIQSAVQAPPAIDPIVDKIIEESINMYIETNNLPKM